MASLLFKNTAANTVGELPSIGSVVDFQNLVTNDLKPSSLSDYAGKNKIISIFPSVDTGVCATSVRHFNQSAASLNNTVVLNVSMDLPFAMARFCGAEGIKNVETLSGFRSDFGSKWGVTLKDSPLAGLYARAVIVLDIENKVLYSELVSDIVNEPNYDKALAVLK
ncbi:MAG: lipid hydroperoxide peroxidase [Bdellovibrionales bacterium CG12_big_fil_rev_8_21_14_0_65_38_15]|nr:MAG: lipid hydroperoxide peroxidase [Bdellovibrionales bacterium CG22_combo_CG10-13_8_21_14_all_38_13]PIQ53557.1 MAG: lipid hydroperoxide peroxidase [Bdellovibrionales bacterium CG12_big_fil_rev_8_21_14_0_65_38_15]PIR28439.1 MAG: lipid hydroperoxide peroxidase [Bdellovibrionales bacterium CG11_big_fil_rev_8_21_14_0_20_38_13]